MIPPKPKFGGFYGPTYEFPWTGGKPLPDLSGTSAFGPKAITSIIPSDPSKYHKIYEAKIGTSIKKMFDPNVPEYPLHAYASDLWRHLEQYGLDTLFYFPDPATGELLDIVNHYPRFTKMGIAEQVHKACQSTGPYGSCPYALSALEDSGSYIYNSVVLNMQTKLQSCMSDKRLGPSGPVLWMALVESIQSTSHMVFKQKVLDLEKISLINFDGENVEAYSEVLKQQCLILSNAKRLPIDINLTILNALCSCSVEEFRFNFFHMRAQENHFLTRTNGMDASTIQGQPDYVDPFEILDRACGIYRNLLELGKWGPKLSANAAMLHRNNRGQGTTRNSATAPPTTPTPPVNPKGSNNNEKGEKGRNKGRTPTATWKGVAPEKGQPTTKLANNGKTYNWCAKCKFWRVGHTTATHKDLPSTQSTIAGKSGSNHIR